MTTLLLALVVIQAAFLLWSSVNLSEVFLRPDKGPQLLRFFATFALPLWLAWYSRTIDSHRTLCGLTDCLALALSVGFVRLWAVNKEEEQFAVQCELATRAATEAVAAARRAQEAERLRAATAVLEAHQASDPGKGTAAPFQQRHLTTPLLRGGARSPRFPGNPRK